MRAHSRRMISPMAMGRMPPEGLVRGMRRR